ncbi:deoxyribodipyrimidine photo-lyase [Morganella morganii]|uniref:deoxyribodipyrimidine photo-lyase n=1 Tax=Morganella morganii TaxID=582 RepID=UPI00050976B4|nr:deoxyribodipyrimidine photo-lyase [Morganella morganii]HBN5712515.1 deoxyribodipyrimidine photo-lyase [Morganella morganii]HDT5775934.1 deoxyribodipyrimidine photo-lyase [Morganella morganii subsp. morganii]
MTDSAPAVVWLRHDLRLTDNTALYAACQAHRQVKLIFTLTPGQWEQHAMSPSQQALIFCQLHALNTSAAALGITLHVQPCHTFEDAADWLAAWCREHRIPAVYVNKQYGLNEQRRDARFAARLPDTCRFYAFDDSVLLPPGSVSTQQGGLYKVFTPFRRAFLTALMQTTVRVLPVPEAKGQPVSPPPLNLPQQEHALFPSGEEAALQRLADFCQKQAADYKTERDFPAIDGTSRISAYLATGILSPRQCLSRLRLHFPMVADEPESGAYTWLSELIWREFYLHQLAQHPDISRHRPMQRWTESIIWSPDNSGLLAWQQGKTGFPLVDAAMRQLNETGWMHNRLRMITASFLVKDLLTDWRRGEHYFMSQLIDGEFAANNGGWQWAASTGHDSVPYFRIFNPVTQGKRFDPDGSFIRRWLPELAEVPAKYIHTPHEWAEKNQREIDYPKPVVDHRMARIRAIDAYETARRTTAGGDDNPY